MKEIAKMWNIPTSQVDSLFPCNKPIIQVIVFFAKVCLLWLFVISSFFTDTPLLQNFASDLQVGRVVLERTQKMVCMDLECAYTEHTVVAGAPHICCFLTFYVQARNQTRIFVDIRSSLYALERIACSVKYNEPILLVGETGTGKTTLVQNLAIRLGQQLTVLVWCKGYLYDFPAIPSFNEPPSGVWGHILICFYFYISEFEQAK